MGFLTAAQFVLGGPPVEAQPEPAPDQTVHPRTRPPTPSAQRPTVKPSAGTTGVPRGTVLKVHHGDLVITKPRTRLDALDIHGFVIVKAPDVTISRSIIRGGRSPMHAIGLVTNYGHPRLLVQDSLLQAAYSSVYIDGIKGSDFTARRVHVIGNVDSIKVQGNNVRIERSLLENTDWYPSDPHQRGGPSHNDNIQVMWGRNVTIRGNTIRGAQNFAILGSATNGDTPNLVIEGNWLDGGHCTVKLATRKNYRLNVRLHNNRFGPHRRVRYCPVQAEPQVPVTGWNNRYEQTRRPIVIYRGR